MKHYAVLTLPIEIVAEIFVHFLPVYPRCPPLVGIGSPTLLTQICRHWREITLATPALWRGISLFDGSSLEFEYQVAIADRWLGRSRSLPVSIRLRASGVNLSSFFAAIIPHRPRWEYLSMEVEAPKEVLAIDGPMPLLRHLDLDLSLVEDDALVVFKHAPLLRTVLVDFAAARLTLPWAQLTSLTLNGLWAFECVSVLRLALNLVHCDLFVAEGYYLEPATLDVTLARLESLKLKVPTLRATPLGGALILPALRRLTVGERIPNPDVIPTLAAFIAQAGCTRLEEVCVAELVSEEEYRAAFPSIRTFTFVDQRTLMDLSSRFSYS
ncbi:hypothetical protein C8F04DRAFT_1067427 [Mycena alexandri]|uniref:F-box domain-containing protein n=1 Tax=Mycena alexandri TaxID=1745969 RepID=A0AAD6TG07_9AGAR|nr:hypothetical protein C8F04DRAFT_1067427 [Mycena alexandri]